MGVVGGLLCVQFIFLLEENHFQTFKEIFQSLVGNLYCRTVLPYPNKLTNKKNSTAESPILKKREIIEITKKIDNIKKVDTVTKHLCVIIIHF